MKRALEREAKLEAWPGFVLPDLEGVVDGGTARPLAPVQLDAVYHDTADLRLARWGVSLRYRSGDGDGWTVKLPEGGDGPALVRRELTFEGSPGAVPADVAALVSAYARSAPLAAVARLKTRRNGVELLDSEGRGLAQVVDDEVSVYEGRHLASRFREIEVELDEATDGRLLEVLVAALKQAGAGDSHSVPKVVRALGTRVLDEPELVAPHVDSDSDLRTVVTGALVASVGRILRHDPGVRIGDDPEDVHQERVGARRLRSDLHTFAPLLQEEVVVPLRNELRWLGGNLGAIRDADVLLERLRVHAASLPQHDAAGAATVLRRLAHLRQKARTAMLEGLSTTRYIDLLDQLVAVATDPPFSADPTQPAKAVLRPLVARRWDQLASAARDLDEVPSDDDLHALRIRAKRCRYAAEAVAPVFGPRARELAKAVAGLQTVLGEHNDAVVAEAWLREAAAASGVSKLVAGELIALQRVEAESVRRVWSESWRGAKEKRLRKWLD